MNRLAFVLFIFCSSLLIARPAMAHGADSLLPTGHLIHNEDIALEMLNGHFGSLELKGEGSKKTVYVRLLEVISRQKKGRDGKLGPKMLNTMAGIAARLRLYPMAMKLYYKSLHIQPLQDSLVEDCTLSSDSLLTEGKFPSPEVESMPVPVSSILASFEDGKKSVSYGLLVHVKQPARGKRKPFKLINNVGHTFITLIKFNEDNSVVCRSFGFYPNKKSLLAATPLHPRSVSVFKDDALHQWDEVAGKFISAETYQKIIALLGRYNGLAYDLNHNNCTDFGLQVARTGGICIEDTRGSWPLGKGNTPASAGQSLLEGKYCNTDPTITSPIFVFYN